MALIVPFLYFPTGGRSEELVSAIECRPRGGLANVVTKLNQGADVRIAYLGGSITAQEGWRQRP